MSSTNIEKIKERLGIEEVVSSYIKLERAGKNLKGKCPFHNEKTASFFVSPDRGNYHCFGCGAGGDIFTFVEQFEGLDFMGALKLLAERAGVQLQFDEKSQAHKNEKERLFAIMEEATKFFEEGLKRYDEAKEYLKKRGVTEETTKKFRLGYVAPEWRLLYTYLKSKKYIDSDMEKAGLIKKKENYYDVFRGRIMFPISDSSGRVIAFSGRILVDDGKSAKYLNSPDTVLFNKSNVLYGIDKAKQDIRIKNYTIVVEGQMDLILSHQAGIRNTVAVSGTALNPDHLGMVKRLSNNIILAFDSDSAGRKAATRSAVIAIGLGMDVKIAEIAGGKDPADLVMENPELWKNVLRKSSPVVEWELNTVLSQKLDPRKLPQALRDTVLPFIAPMTGAMEKAHYIKLIKERTGLSEESVREDLRKIAVVSDTKSDTKIIENTQVSRGQRDSIVRRLFGLIYFLEKNPASGIDIEDYKNSIKAISTDKYEEIVKSVAPYKDEVLLEAEIIYGSNKDIKKDLDELMLNFESDLVREEFAEIMKPGVAVDEDKLGRLIKRKKEIENNINFYEKNKKSKKE
ncbi:MAG TPA: DNA primase [Candidatus Paceibacterota bacterium]